jgi:predicted DNA-binding protein with PD1-like motif
MILTQSHKRRNFVGSLNAGADLIEAIRKMCVDNTILCGFLQGTGYLKDAKLRTFDATSRAYRDPETHSGTLHVVSLSGNISLVDRQTSIRCHVVGTVSRSGHPPVLVSGELVGAEIVALEFTLDAIDDLRFYRARDERSGLDGWLHLEFVQGGNPIVRQTPPDTAPIPAGPPAPAPIAAPLPAPAPPKSRKAPKVEAVDTSVPEIRPGDFLNHPTLGRCEVMTADQEDRLSIKLESGRIVELHTGLVDITPSAPVDGARVFNVSIRRRR